MSQTCLYSPTSNLKHLLFVENMNFKTQKKTKTSQSSQKKFIHQNHLKPVYIQKENIGLMANLRAMHVKCSL